MTGEEQEARVVSASRDIAAAPDVIFELIADPARQPSWDGNDNLDEAAAGQRVRRAGDVFVMRTTKGSVRENHVVEFEEGRRIAWTPAEPGQAPPGHLWRWELDPVDASLTRVTHTYDWTRLTDEKRLSRARATTSDKLRASLDRLATLAEPTRTDGRTQMRTLHFGLRVADLDRSLAFYTALGYEVVGTAPGTHFGDLTMLKLPGDEFVSLELVSGTPPEKANGAFEYFVIKVESMESALAGFAAAGIAAEEPSSADGGEGFFTSWTTDPDGNRIELVQWPAGHADGLTAADWSG